MTHALPKPWYRDEQVTFPLGDAQDIRSAVLPGSVDYVVATALAVHQFGCKAVLVDTRGECHCMGLARQLTGSPAAATRVRAIENGSSR